MVVVPLHPEEDSQPLIFHLLRVTHLLLLILASIKCYSVHSIEYAHRCQALAKEAELLQSRVIGQIED